MDNPIPKIVEELMRFREASQESVATFRKLKHNKYLCPRAEEQLRRVLDCFIKFRHVAYDVQGVHDRGTDVVLRYGTDEALASDSWTCICVQLKSFDDMDKGGYLKDLKSQFHDAESEYRGQLAQYYILLCTDPSAHIDKIREVKKSFANHTQVTIVDPSYCHTFLRMGAVNIAVVVDSLLREGDTVRQLAIDEVARLTPTEAAVALAATYIATFGTKTTVDIRDFRNAPFIAAMYEMVPDYPRDYFFQDDDDVGPDNDFVGDTSEEDGIESDDDEALQNEDWTDDEVESFDDRGRPFEERLVDDLSALEDNILTACADSTFIVDLDVVRPLQAMLLDSHLRYKYEDATLLKYTFGCLRVLERCGINPMDGEPPLIP